MRGVLGVAAGLVAGILAMVVIAIVGGDARPPHSA